MTNTNDNNENLNEKILSLEKRILKLENILGINVDENISLKKQIVENKQDIVKSDIGFESKFGEFGLAWLGSIVLLFGITFLTQYIQNSGFPIISVILGYIAAAIVFFISYKIKIGFSNISDKLYIISHILVYYITLKIFYFTNFKVISSELICFSLLLLLNIFQIYISLKRKSEFFTAIILSLTVITSFISTFQYISFILITLVCVLSIYLTNKNNWWKQLFFIQLIAYFYFLIWYLNQTSYIKNINTDNFALLFLCIIVSAFSFITLIKQNDKINNAIVFVSVVINGLLFTINIALYILTFYTSNYIGVFGAISAICILFSVILKKYSDWKFTPAFYALYGFVTMSISVFGIFGLPLVFLLLTIQSLLVISMAIWFKSKIIAVMNFFLFISLLATYFISANSINSINFSFAFVALVSARIINWKKERLEIKTELLRNVYLIVAFFTLLYALFKAVPSNYVTLSWGLAAIVYFVTSLILKNTKYRLMAIFTMIAAVFYLFIVDLSVIDIVYRILAFMFVAIISIAFSIYYSKRKKKNPDNQE